MRAPEGAFQGTPSAAGWSELSLEQLLPPQRIMNHEEEQFKRETEKQGKGLKIFEPCSENEHRQMLLLEEKSEVPRASPTAAETGAQQQPRGTKPLQPATSRWERPALLEMAQGGVRNHRWIPYNSQFRAAPERTLMSCAGRKTHPKIRVTM